MKFADVLFKLTMFLGFALFAIGCAGYASDGGEGASTSDSSDSDTGTAIPDLPPIPENNCNDSALPADWGNAHAEMSLHSCVLNTDGIGECCIAVRIDADLVGDIDVWTMDGEQFFDYPNVYAHLEGFNDVWFSDGTTQHGVFTWDSCALPTYDPRISVRLTASDLDLGPDNDPLEGINMFKIYQIIYLSNFSYC